MKSVVVCSSKKYKKEVLEFCESLEKLGIIVFRPNISEPINEDAFLVSKHITKTIFKGLTFEHFDWVRKADVCYIYNKDNYVGASVTMEMAYAEALSKIIIALNPQTEDPCRDALIDFVIDDEKELAKFLS